MQSKFDQIEFYEANIQMLVSFAQLMPLYAHLLFPCLEKLFAYIVYLQPNETILNMSSETIHLRRHAASSLGKIAMSMPDALQSSVSQIASTISSLVPRNLILLNSLS